MKKALVIYSGGQDSTTCLFWALNRYDSVEAICFNYGQNHSIEVQQARKICKDAMVKFTVVDMTFLNTIVASSLLNKGDVNVINEKGLPASFVPNRNQLFITLAHAMAQKIGADTLVTGVCQTDYSGYMDCRQEFIDMIKLASNYGSKSNINMETPLMNLTKADTFELAHVEGCLDVVIEDSHTCYNGDREHKHEWGYGCDNCPACELRKKGYFEYIKTL